MIKLRKRLLTAGLCIAMTAALLAGCGSNAGKAIATLDGEKVDFALANFMVRYNQAQMQSAYGAMFGDNMWSSYGETTKSGIMETIEQQLILEKHMDEYKVTISDEEKAQITEAAKEFLETNDEKVLDAMTASQETIERMLTLTLIQSKMQKAIIADVDTEVSDEEAAQKTIQYVLFSTADSTDEEGNTVTLTDEEKTAMKEQAQQVLDAVKGGEELDAAAKAVDESKAASTSSYGTDNGTIPDEVKTAADALEDGQVADSVVETENGYYVVQMQSTFDEEATQNQKATIVSQRQSDKFEEVYNGWKEGVTFTTDEKLLEKIDFVDTFEVKTTEAATEAGSESATEAVSQAATEAGSETEAAETTTETAADEPQSESAAETETAAK